MTTPTSKYNPPGSTGRLKGNEHGMPTSGGRTCQGAYSPDWSGDESGRLLPPDGTMSQRDYTKGGSTNNMGPLKYKVLNDSDTAYNPGRTPNRYVVNDVPSATGHAGAYNMGAEIDYTSGQGTDEVIQKWHGDGGFAGPAAGNQRLNFDCGTFRPGTNNAALDSYAGNHPDAGTNRRTNVGQMSDPSARPKRWGWGTEAAGGERKGLKQGSEAVPTLDGSKWTWE